MKNLSLVFVSILLSGCAMKATRVNIAAQQSPEVLVCLDALQRSMGIASIQDDRPPAEKAGGKPHGIYLLLWNQRIGNYMSGNKDFLDLLETSMPEQMGRSISRSNCFVETKTLKTKVGPQPSAEELLVVFSKEKVRYVLVSQVKHFYGQQRQKAYFYAIPAFYVDFFGWGNQAGNAQGHTDIIFILYDTQMGQEVLRERVVTDAFSPIAGAYPQVASESFLEASQKISNHLYRFAQMQQGSPVFKPEKP